jgi:hypothetical protein
MAISQVSRMNSTIFGFNHPFVQQFNLKDIRADSSWRKNLLFSEKWRKILGIFQVNSKIKITECILIANNQDYSFHNSNEFTYYELEKMKDQDLFPDFPSELNDFKFLKLAFIDIQSGLKIEAQMSEYGKVYYTFQKNDSILYKLKVNLEINKVFRLKYEFMNPSRIFDIEISEFEIAIGIQDKNSNKRISLIANQQKTDFTLKVEDIESDTFFEVHDLAYVNNYFKLENEIQNSELKYQINPYANISNKTINKESLKQGFIQILKKWTKLWSYIKDFVEIQKNIQKTLKTREITSYSTLFHFYYEPEYENSEFSTNIHVYLKNLNRIEIEKLETQFENKDFAPKEYNNEFTVDFWSQNLE